MLSYRKVSIRMETKKPRKRYGRGPKITRTQELAKELRDAVKLAIENWATSARATLQGQGYQDESIEAVLTKITDAAYKGLTWKTLHKGEGFNDPYHERELEEFFAGHPDGSVKETRVGFRHLSYPVFKKEDIERAFNDGRDIPPLFKTDE